MRKIIVSLLVLFTGLFITVFSVSAETPLIPVPKEKVCMVNDTLMNKDQIPVPFDGRTYYGCCEMCVEKLNGEKAARTAKDPLTGDEVDKASAFIVVNKKNKVFYFESEQNFRRFVEKETK